jgi:CheY-like chemotaxis protein
MSSGDGVGRVTSAIKSEPATAQNRRFRVLLAEDDHEMCRLLTDALHRSGYEVLDVSDGLTLVERIQAWWRPEAGAAPCRIDLVVSDVRMPWATGLVALRLLREYDRVTPMILITAFGDEQTHREADSLGASAVLDKPFDLDEFLSLAGQLVRKAESGSSPVPGGYPGAVEGGDSENGSPGLGAAF